MLENIKQGDVCVFTNGERRIVQDFNIFRDGSIRVYFNTWIVSQLTEDSAAATNWVYHMNGKIVGLSKPNNIEKVIKAS